MKPILIKMQLTKTKSQHPAVNRYHLKLSTPPMRSARSHTKFTQFNLFYFKVDCVQHALKNDSNKFNQCECMHATQFAKLFKKL